MSDRDLPFCGGDCSATGDSGLNSLLDLSADFLSQASPFEAYAVPGAGHGMGLVGYPVTALFRQETMRRLTRASQEYSHAEVTGKILDFLTQNGLAAN